MGSVTTTSFTSIFGDGLTSGEVTLTAKTSNSSSAMAFPISKLETSLQFLKQIGPFR